MKRLFSLVRVVSKQGFDDILSMTNVQNKQNTSNNRKVLQILLAVGLIIYLGTLIFVPVYYITEKFVQLGQASLIVSLLFTIGPIVSLYFAILSTPGIFYFANDTQDLLTLPLQPWEIVFARFASAYLQTLIGSALIYFPFLVSYFILASPGILFIITATIAFLIVPIIPLVLAYLVTVVTMSFIPFIKNKDLYMYFSFGMVIIPSIFITFFLTGFSEDADILNIIVGSLMSGDNAIYKYLDIFLPTSKMLVNWVIDYFIIDLLLALVLSIGLLLVVIVVTQKLYFSGLLSIKESSSKKRRLHKGENEQALKQSSVDKAILMYDLKRILRTPSFALNYFSPVLMIPIFTVIPLLTNGIPTLLEMQGYIKEISLMFNELIREVDFAKSLATTLAVGVGLGMFMGNLDASSNTAISREGHTMKQFLTMPIKLSQIVHAKAKFSIIANSIFPIIITLIAVIVLRPPIILVIAFVFSLATGVLFITYVSLLVDVVSPSLNWTTEQQAAKGSFKTVIIVLPFILIPILIVVMGLFAYSYISLVLLGIVLPALTFGLYKWVTKLADTTLVNRIQNL